MALPFDEIGATPACRRHGTGRSAAPRRRSLGDPVA